jgi:hypothetical protein
MGHVATPEPPPPTPGAGLELRDTWRHRSPSQSGGVPGATGHVAVPELSGVHRHRSPFLSGAVSGAMGLDLSLAHGGTRFAGYRQWPSNPPRKR